MIEYILLIAILVFVFVFVRYIYKKLKTPEQHSEQFASINQSIGSLKQVVKDSQEENRRMTDYIKAIFTSPGKRGSFGEVALNRILKELPSEWVGRKYEFKDGKQVDNYIKLARKIIPIDSKFPLNSFERMDETGDKESNKVLEKKFTAALKKYIKDVASKYIRPDENTINHAFIYLPSVSIYETAISNKDILEYARQNNIVLTSSHNLAAALEPYITQLRETKVAEEAKRMLKMINALKVHTDLLGSDVQKLSKNIKDAGHNMSNVNLKVTELSSKVDSLDSYS